ncbi:MAG: hypothetical protein HZA35_00910 [Parcubacteria group bacterium]|nr:hypothetical protein [Parcubacteria group bacterium]
MKRRVKQNHFFDGLKKIGSLDKRGPLHLLVTLWPSFPHFFAFANDERLAGIRLNSAMMDNPELEKELELISSNRSNITVPLYFDVKGRQLRVAEVLGDSETPYLDICLNHSIEVRTPTTVLFKAGADGARLLAIEEGGYRLVFDGGPMYRVKPGESLHVLDHNLEVLGSQFTDAELHKIETVRRAGFTRYFLSYVESQRDVDEFLELVGRDAEVWLKIENQKGLSFVRHEFRKRPNLTLVAARGDLYVELAGCEILDALRLIIDRDPKACVGSRILLSTIHDVIPLNVLDELHYLINKNSESCTGLKALLSEVQDDRPSCADLSDLAWLYDLGYRNIMLCDELCLKERWLGKAINVFDEFRTSLENKK